MDNYEDSGLDFMGGFALLSLVIWVGGAALLILTVLLGQGRV
ncbi:hypothetical protein [Devosia sp.]|nr:hypothetical protein [Devosia sp.]